MKITSLGGRGAWVAIAGAITVATTDAATMRGRSGETYTVDSNVAELVAKAAMALHKNEPERAIAYSTAALRTQLPPGAAAAIYDLRGCAYADAEKAEPALRDANECLRLNPRHFGGYQTRGRVYRLKGEFDKAIAEYDKAVQLNPGFAYLYNNRGVAYSKMGDERRAIREYDEALRREPRMADGYGNRAISFQALREFDKALADYNKAIRLGPHLGFFYYGRGTLFLATGRREDAIRDLGECIRREPQDPDAYVVRARALAEKRMYAQARKDLEKAVALRPNYPFALNSLAWLKATCVEDSMRDGRAAVGLASKACEVSKWKNPRYLDTLAAAYAETGDFEKAVEMEKRAVGLSTPGSSEREEKESRLRLYQERKPFRETESSG